MYISNSNGAQCGDTLARLGRGRARRFERRALESVTGRRSHALKYIPTRCKVLFPRIGEKRRFTPAPRQFDRIINDS